MSFDEIFDQDGLYVANGFALGFAYHIYKGGLTYVLYENSGDENHLEDRVKLYKPSLHKDYRKVETVAELF